MVKAAGGQFITLTEVTWNDMDGRKSDGKEKNYGKYKRGEFVYADFGHKPAGVQVDINLCDREL